MSRSGTDASSVSGRSASRYAWIWPATSVSTGSRPDRPARSTASSRHLGVHRGPPLPAAFTGHPRPPGADVDVGHVQR